MPDDDKPGRPGASPPLRPATRRRPQAVDEPEPVAQEEPATTPAATLAERLAVLRAEVPGPEPTPKAPAKKASAKKGAAKKSPAKTAAVRAPSGEAVTKKAPAKKAAGTTPSAPGVPAPAAKPSAKKAPGKRTPAKKAPAKKAVSATAAPAARAAAAAAVPAGTPAVPARKLPPPPPPPSPAPVTEAITGPVEVLLPRGNPGWVRVLLVLTALLLAGAAGLGAAAFVASGNDPARSTEVGAGLLSGGAVLLLAGVVAVATRRSRS